MRERASSMRIGRYAVYGTIGAGGMAAVHLGRLFGPRGFARIVAVKRLNAAYADDADFAPRFLQEARLASRIRHPNVVPVLDVIAEENEVLLVMEYVHGESLARLGRIAKERGQRLPMAIASAVVSGVLHGLDAAHTAESEDGAPLGIVHRDVSPQNVLVGADGVARLVDFGVAKAAGSDVATTRGGAMGKLAYMAPEQLRRQPVSGRTDVYSASVVLWEALTGRRLFRGDDEGAIVEQILVGLVPPPSKFAYDVSEELDAIVLRGLATDPSARPDARSMALALEAAAPPALPSTVGVWVTGLAGEILAKRDEERRRIETESAPEAKASSSRAAVVRRPRATRAAVGILLVAGVVGAAIAAQRLRVRQEPSATATATATATASPTATATATPTATATATAIASTAERPRVAPARPAVAVRATATPAPAASAPPAPSQAATSCQSIDPVTGDVHFDRSCR